MTTMTTTEAIKLRDDARMLDGLMNQTTHVRLVWSDRDYGPMIRHQLDAPLAADLAQLLPEAHDTLSDVPMRTFQDLLFHPTPPVQALRLVKDFAKQLQRNAQFAYPEDVAILLYYTSIVAAELKTQTAISDLPQEEVRNGYRWSRDRTWIPEDLKRLFEEALGED